MAGPSRRRSPNRAEGRRPASRASRSPRSRPRARRRRRSGRTPFAVFALLIVGFTVVFVAGAQALVTQSSLQISELEEQAERLATRSEILRLRVADLSSPDNIVRVAEDAGLVTPTAVRILRLSDSEGRDTAVSNGAASEDALALKEGSGGSG